MNRRVTIYLLAVCVLSGCAHEANSYRKAEGLVNDAQEKAFAACRANATPILSSSGGILGQPAYHQAIVDCMSVQGYVKQ